MPSTRSISMPKVWLSSTVMTPSLPTLSIASEIISPISVSADEMAAPWLIWSLESTSLASSLMLWTAASTPASMPFFRVIGLAPAATLRRPSRTIDHASTVAVLVPSPATSSVFLATSLTSSAPMRSYGSSSSISLAMETPSLVIVGAPHFLSSTTLRPLGPSVTLTASASWFMPRSRPRRASSSNAINLAIGYGPHFSYGHACSFREDGARDGWPALTGLTAFRLALSLAECQFEFGTRPLGVQGRGRGVHPGSAPAVRGPRDSKTAPDTRPGPLREVLGSGVDDLDAVGLGTLGALDDLELPPLVLVESRLAVRLDPR